MSLRCFWTGRLSSWHRARHKRRHIWRSEYFAWTEWFPADPVQIGGFPVSPGDTMSVFLQILSLDAESFGIPLGFPIGQALVTNVSQGKFPTVARAGPLISGSTPFQGSSAEWIVETPGPRGDVFEALPYFGLVAFAERVAADNNGTETQFLQLTV
jgi:hypothetical protein